MSDVEAVKAEQLYFESFLRTVLSAKGRTFMEMINHAKAEGRIDEPTAGHLHAVRMLRNALVHERSGRLPDPGKFWGACSGAREGLLRGAVPGGTTIGLKLTSVGDGRCIDAPWELGVDRVYQWSHHSGKNQRWVLREFDPGWYFVLSQWTGRVLDVAGGAMDSRTSVIQWGWHGGESQQWAVERVDMGAYRLRARHSGLVLTVADASCADGVPLVQAHADDTALQKWWIGPAV